MRSFALLLMIAAVAALGMAAACTDLGIGKKCVNPTDAGVNGVQLSSPALECVSRLCLLTPPGGGNPSPRSICTAECKTDADCAGAVSGMSANGQCDTGFACAVATVSGPFCCKTICICRGDLVPNTNQDPVDGGVITPPSCKPGSGSACPNIH